jgi:enterochelin esterase-like enzyme
MAAMSSSRRPVGLKPFSPSVELLESRQLLAGGVTTSPASIPALDAENLDEPIEFETVRIGEAGSVDVYQRGRDLWSRVDLSGRYVNPVVIMSPASNNGGQPSTVRVRNAGAGSFEFQLDEWDYLDGKHITETFGYVVMEAGRHVFADGTVVEAGTLSPVDHRWQEYVFSEFFDSVPALFTQVMSDRDDAAVVTRHNIVAASGFQLRLMEEEAADGAHGSEMVGYLAIEHGQGNSGDVAFEAWSTTGGVDNRWYALNYGSSYADPPVFLAGMRSANDLDPVAVRYRYEGDSGVQVRLQEEQSANNEMAHAAETVDYAFFEAGELWVSEALPFAGGMGEAGRVAASQANAGQWHTVEMQRTYSEPVVVMSPISSNAADLGMPRVRNVQAGSFEFQIDEWDYLNGKHRTEIFGYVVLEAGRYVLDDGTMVDAGTLAAVNDQWIGHSFDQPFETVPVVLTQTSSYVDSAAVAIRLTDVTAAGFQVRLQEEEAADGSHANEQVSYIAIERGAGSTGGENYETGSTGDRVDRIFRGIRRKQFFSLDPVFLASVQTANNLDPVTLRYRIHDEVFALVRLEEEQSLDTEKNHPYEAVGYAFFEEGLIRTHDAARQNEGFFQHAVDLAVLEHLYGVRAVPEEPQPYAAYFDFGTANSTVKGGYTRVTHATKYTAGRGYGWSKGNVQSRDTGISTALDRDLNYSRDATFVVDVPNGKYQVDLIVGDRGNVVHDQMSFYLEGVQVGTKTTGPQRVVGRGYRTEVTDGQLTLRLRDLGGRDPHVAIEALRIYTADSGLPQTSGPWWPSPPKAPGGFFHQPVRSGGFKIYTVESIYQKSSVKIRVLTPNTLVAGQEYRVVYVLPVEPGEKREYGDGLATVRNLNLHNRHNVIFVAPTFTDMPWYADHVSAKKVWQETHFRTVVVPFIEEQYPVVAGPEGRLLLGFSKSGYGAFSMLLRHPDFFGRAVAWDAPVAMSSPSEGYAFTDILGSTQNFGNYRITTLVRQRKNLLKTQPARLLLLGYGDNSFRSDHRELHQLMNSLGIPHVFVDGPHRSHHWNSGWVGDAVRRLLG